AQYTQLFTLFMVAGLLLYCVSCIGYILTSMHYIKQQPIIHIVGLATNLICCFLLIRIYGLNGAAYAWIISFAAQLIISVLLLNKSYKNILKPAV
ncbi:MAG TPA: polysaccharide biosynthesis C-terminal domain-containing protein, partial [Chitinophagaceae bacterium]|nr:polysaccharide biosynthesis C-terminal domain-containing protein [Chitinophagaceae bacterium]